MAISSATSASGGTANYLQQIKQAAEMRATDGGPAVKAASSAPAMPPADEAAKQASATQSYVNAQGQVTGLNINVTA
jgi:hypothetical protein